MTEQELDLFMRNVLLDAIALDEETNTETIPYTPSLHHQKQIKAMLKNPLRWARDRKQPVWKKSLKAGRCHTAGDLACIRQFDGR